MTHPQSKSASPFPSIPVKASENTDGITYIISIGIDQYGFPGVNDFLYKNCKKDAKDLLDCLVTQYENFKAYAALYDQDATLSKIYGCIQDFIGDEDKNTSNNSILIYFSGHGNEMVSGGDSAVGCLVPHGINKLVVGQLIKFDRLVSEFRELKTKNCVVIVDACKSASLFKEIRSNSDSADAPTHAKDERFSAAIVSCRANEVSKAGGAGENSFFTKELLKVLNKPKQSNFSFIELFTILDDIFKSAANQKPFYGKIEQPGRNNSGAFHFRQKEDLVRTQKIDSILTERLRIINFEPQKIYLREFNSLHKKQMAIFRGKPESGLGLLWDLTAQSIHFPQKHDCISQRAYPSSIIGDSNQKVMAIFNDLLNTTHTTFQQISEAVASRLENNGILLKVILPALDEEETFRPQERSALFNAFIELLLLIPDKSENKITVCMIDQADQDFSEFYKGQTEPGLKILYFPPIDQFNDDKAYAWYDESRIMYGKDQALRDEFDTYFNETLYTKISQICEQANFQPGRTIELICDTMACPKIADQLLKKPLS